jgi:hypothetical protein
MTTGLTRLHLLKDKFRCPVVEKNEKRKQRDQAKLSLSASA